MMRQNHTHRGAVPTRRARVLAVFALLALPAVDARAQHNPQTPAELPSIAAAVAAFRTARLWIDDFDPPALDSPDAAAPLPGAAGVYIALRTNGRITAAGTDASADDLALRRAVGRALSELLGDDAVRSVPDDLRHTIGRSLTLECEIAGPLRPIIARTNAQLAAHYEPGLDGLAMRRGGELVMVFPAALRRTGNADNIDAALARLASALRLKAAPLAELLDRHNISLYRFRALHLTQSEPAGSPHTTHRGLRIVHIDDVTTQSIQRFADAAAAHLINRLWAGDEPLGLLGEYNLVRDQYQPLLALPRDQALTALALGVYANALAPDDPQRPRAHDAAVRILTQLADVAEVEPDPFGDPAACALMLAAISRLPGPIDAEHGRLLDRARRSLDALTELNDDDLRDAMRGFDPTTRGMIAFSLACTTVRDAVEPASGPLRRLMIACIDVTDEMSYVALMPWICWAEQLADPGVDLRVTPIVELQRLRAALHLRQVAQPGSPVAARPGNTDWVDLVGGFSLSAPAAAVSARPTAQSTRPAFLLAVLLMDDRHTTPGERAAAAQVQRRAMRYLMQLQVTEADAWMLAHPERALGGLRAATWSDDLPAAATAMGLIAAVHTIGGTEHRSSEPSP